MEDYENTAKRLQEKPGFLYFFSGFIFLPVSMAKWKHLWLLKNSLLSFHLAPPLEPYLLSCGWHKRVQGLGQYKAKAFIQIKPLVFLLLLLWTLFSCQWHLLAFTAFINQVNRVSEDSSSLGFFSAVNSSGFSLPTHAFEHNVFALIT